MSKLETNTIDTISGSTNLTLGGTNATDITIPAGVTLTNNGTASGFGVPGITSSSTSGTALNITASNNLEISAGKNLTFSSSTAPLVNIDNTTVTVTLTNGSSIDYVANSGIWGFCDHTATGQTAIFVGGGGSTAVFQAFSTYSNTSGSGSIRFFYNAGTSAHRLQNNIGSTITISCFNIKLRNSA